MLRAMPKIGNGSLRIGVLGVLLAASTLFVPAHAAPDDAAVVRSAPERTATPSPAETVVQAATAAAQPAGLMSQVRDQASDMVLTAMNFLGVPYRRGGGSESTGFDCSGFTRHIFEMSLGLVLPRRADEQAKAKGLISIGRDELKPGDLVFFNTLRRTFSHVGIYVGDNKFIHSPSAGGKVRVEDMRLPYWTNRYTGARRVDLTAALDNTATASLR
jgi:cell wall-associated NlpC family hydrolase